MPEKYNAIGPQTHIYYKCKSARVGRVFKGNSTLNKSTKAYRAEKNTTQFNTAKEHIKVLEKYNKGQILKRYKQLWVRGELDDVEEYINDKFDSKQDETRTGCEKKTQQRKRVFVHHARIFIKELKHYFLELEKSNNVTNTNNNCNTQKVDLSKQLVQKQKTKNDSENTNTTEEKSNVSNEPENTNVPSLSSTESSVNSHRMDKDDIILTIISYLSDNLTDFLNVLRSVENREAFGKMERDIVCGGILNAIIDANPNELVMLYNKLPFATKVSLDEEKEDTNQVSQFYIYVVHPSSTLNMTNDDKKDELIIPPFMTTKRENGKVYQQNKITKANIYVTEKKWGNSNSDASPLKIQRKSKNNIIKLTQIPIFSIMTCDSIVNRKLFIGCGDFRFEALYSLYVKKVNEIIVATELSSKIECIKKYSEYNIESNINTIKAKSGIVRFDFDATNLSNYYSNQQIEFDEIVSIFPYVKPGKSRNVQTPNNELVTKMMNSVISSLAKNGHFSLVIRKKDKNFAKAVKQHPFSKTHKNSFKMEDWTELGYYHKKTHDSSSSVNKSDTVSVHTFCKSDTCHCRGYNTFLQKL